MKSRVTRIFSILFICFLGFIMYKKFKKSQQMPQKVPQPVILAAPTPSENAHEKSFIQALTTINELEKKIQTSTMPIIIKCSATWCPPCKAMKPLYEQLAQEL